MVPPACGAVDPAGAGVSRPCDRLPANLPVRGSRRQEQAALLSCHTAYSYSATFSCVISTTDTYQNTQPSSSCRLIGPERFRTTTIQDSGCESKAPTTLPLSLLKGRVRPEFAQYWL